MGLACLKQNATERRRGVTLYAKHAGVDAAVHPYTVN